MTGTGRAMVSTPAIAHSEPTIFPHTPTGLYTKNIYNHPSKNFPQTAKATN